MEEDTNPSSLIATASCGKEYLQKTHLGLLLLRAAAPRLRELPEETRCLFPLRCIGEG